MCDSTEVPPLHTTHDYAVGNTNNYAEVGIRILKELIFGRVKGLQFSTDVDFVVETLELYYKRKLVNVANNRL